MATVKPQWSAELTSYRPSEEAPDFMALVYDPTPEGRRNDDGTTSFSVRFPALILTEYVGDQNTAAPEIADQLNAYASQKAEIDRLRDFIKSIKTHGEMANISAGREWGSSGKKPASKDVWCFPRHMLNDLEAALSESK